MLRYVEKDVEGKMLDKRDGYIETKRPIGETSEAKNSYGATVID